MRAIKSTSMWPSQRCFEHNGREYSVVNLTLSPLRAHQNPDEKTRESIKESESLLQFYKPCKYELADITDGVEVISRFKSVEEAKRYIVNEYDPQLRRGGMEA